MARDLAQRVQNNQAARQNDGPYRHPNAARQDAHSACRPCNVYTGRDNAPTP